MGKGGLMFGTCAQFKLYLCTIKRCSNQINRDIPYILLILCEFNVTNRNEGWSTTLESDLPQSLRYNLFRYNLLFNKNKVNIFYILDLGIPLYIYEQTFLSKKKINAI